jgi:hypothetical protein
MLNVHRVDSERDQYGNRIDWIPLDNPVFEQVKQELQPIFDRIVQRNKRLWDQQIRAYERTRQSEGNKNFKFPRSERYGV